MVRYVTTIILILLSLLGFPFMSEVQDLIDQYFLEDQLSLIQSLRNIGNEKE